MEYKNALKYRRETGMCETCNTEIDIHPICARCYILLGRGHESMISYDEDKKLWCGHCGPTLEVINENRE